MANINTHLFDILSYIGYEDKSEAYDAIREYYSDLRGVTTTCVDGKYYIVQSKEPSLR